MEVFWGIKYFMVRRVALDCVWGLTQPQIGTMNVTTGGPGKVFRDGISLIDLLNQFPDNETADHGSWMRSYD